MTNRPVYFPIIFILSIILLILAPAAARAVVAPYYAYGEANTRYGIPDFGVIEEVSQENAGSVSVSAGNPWWCETPNCGVTVEYGDRSAWGEVDVDPVSGTLRARAGSMAYGVYSGYGEAYGYASQVFRVGSDGSLSPGDLVILDLGMMLEGTIDANSWAGQVGGLVTVNYFDPNHQYVDGFGNPLDYMPLGTFQDLLFSSQELSQMPGAVQYYANQNTTLTSFSGFDNFDVQVGDVLVLESMLYVSNELYFSDGYNDSWTDFDNTLSSTLAPTTAGATLNAVPLPPALYLFMSGMLLLLARGKPGRH